MRRTQRIGGFPGDTQGVGDRELVFAFEPGPERFAPDVGHDVVEEPVGLTAVEQRENVGMLQPGGGLDFAQEPLAAQRSGQLGMEDLDGDRAVVTEVVGQIHGGHATCPELALDAVAVGESSCKLGEPIHVSRKATLPGGPGLGSGIRPRRPYRGEGIRRPGV